MKLTSPRAVVRPIDLPPGRRVLAVSDIHGNLPLLQGALRRAGFCQDDILLVLGDMLERSEGSLDVLQYVMELSHEYTVYTLLGNCDNITPAFFRRQREIPDAFYQRWFARLGEKCALVKMAHLAGASVDSPADYPGARRAILEKFREEIDFLMGLPHIYLHPDYLFVHGGVPREDRLEELDAFGCMKNDAFLEQEHTFRRWLVVGHWPVTLYRTDIPSADPIVDRRRHVVSIDGGCTLKWDGQVNVLCLPQTPGEAFSWFRYDGLPTVTARTAQAPGADPVNIRFGHSALEVLEEGEEFCRCRHRETGRELDVLTEYLYRQPDGVWCEDSTDYLLPVSPGDTLSVVRKTSRGLLAKKDGVTGWYRGSWESGA